MQVTPTNKFRSRWTICRSDASKAESSSMKNVKQKFLQSHFLQLYHQGLLKDEKSRLIDKTQTSDTTKRELY